MEFKIPGQKVNKKIINNCYGPNFKGPRSHGPKELIRRAFNENGYNPRAVQNHHGPNGFGPNNIRGGPHDGFGPNNGISNEYNGYNHKGGPNYGSDSDSDDYNQSNRKQGYDASVKSLSDSPSEKISFAKAIVLSCIDYRFIDSTINFLESTPKLAGKHNLTALPGGSLGYNQKKYEYWRKTFIDIVNLSIELHGIKKIIVFDHMDCGAYHMFYPEIEKPEEERILHVKNITKFARKLSKMFPKLKCEGFLIHDNGKVERIV